MKYLKINKIIAVILLAYTYASCLTKANAQDTISINQEDYEFRQTPNKFGRTQAFAKLSNKPLQKGFYKAVDNYRSTIFSINDSGYLQGEKRLLSGTRLQSLSNWDNGKFIREYTYSHDTGRLLEELFDSSAAIFLYDSITNNWNRKFTTVRVHREFSIIKGSESDWKMVFSGGAKYAYAIFSFRNGNMTSENYIDFNYRQYNSKGNVVLEEVYNWKLKQREFTSFTDTVKWKSIITDKNMSWNKDGTISYLNVGESGEDKQTALYKSGKLVKREVYKNNTKTIIEYDNKGKIKSKEVYKLPKVDNEIRSPV